MIISDLRLSQIIFYFLCPSFIQACDAQYSSVLMEFLLRHVDFQCYTLLECDETFQTENRSLSRYFG